MSDRGLKLFLATAVFCFVTRDIGVIVMLSKKDGTSLKKLKNWITENIMGTAIELKPEFERIEKFRRKMNNVKDA